MVDDSIFRLPMAMKNVWTRLSIMGQMSPWGTTVAAHHCTWPPCADTLASSAPWSWLVQLKGWFAVHLVLPRHEISCGAFFWFSLLAILLFELWHLEIHSSSLGWLSWGIVHRQTSFISWKYVLYLIIKVQLILDKILDAYGYNTWSLLTDTNASIPNKVTKWAVSHLLLRLQDQQVWEEQG